MGKSQGRKLSVLSESIQGGKHVLVLQMKKVQAPVLLDKHARHLPMSLKQDFRQEDIQVKLTIK